MDRALRELVARGSVYRALQLKGKMPWDGDVDLATPAPVIVVPLVLTEVLQGFRTDHDFLQAQDHLLLGLPILTLDVDGHVAAARVAIAGSGQRRHVRGFAIDCVVPRRA